MNSVKNSYNVIAKEFSQTRNYDWPEFEIFWKYIELLQGRTKFKILDIGCGNGRLISFLQKKLGENFNYIGADISDGLIEEAKRLYPNFKFICLDMVDLNMIKKDSIDLIFSIASFHHLNSLESRMRHLKELKRILKPGGIVCMTNWNLFQKKYFKCFFINFFQKKSWNDTFVPFKSGGKNLANRYYHAFFPFELNRLFKKSGLKLEKEFFIKKGEIKKGLIGSFNICSILKKE